MADSQVHAIFSDNKTDITHNEDKENLWTIRFAGILTAYGVGSAFALTSPTGITYHQITHLRFLATSATAEYEGLLAGLRHALDQGIEHLHIEADSEILDTSRSDQLLTGTKGTTYDKEIQLKCTQFQTCTYKRTLRRNSTMIKALARQAPLRCLLPSGMIRYSQTSPSV
uniref:RNase H type-1 domain-containing protein n=1 Tax=Leersia perrieri TaxID=77586 RepID=A0A0D9V0Q1_9ORYZ